MKVVFAEVQNVVGKRIGRLMYQMPEKEPILENSRIG